MSQHSYRTQFGPPRSWIAAGAVLVLASAVGTGYMIAGLEPDGRDVAGFLMGVALTGLLAGHTVGLIVQRAVMRDRALRLRAERWAARQEAGPDPVAQAVDEELERYANEVADRYLDEELDPDGVESGEFAGWTYGGQPVDDVPPLAPPTYPEPVAREDEDLEYQADPARPWRAADPDEELENREPSPQEIERWARYGGGQPDPVEQATAVLKRVVDDFREPEHRPPYDRHTMPTWNAFTTAQERQAALSQVAVPLPPREGGQRPYVDPGPYSQFVGVPVSPGHSDRALGEADTVVLARIEDQSTEVIERVQS